MKPALRHVAPAGAPIRSTDLIRWARFAAGHEPERLLRDSIAARFGQSHVFLTSTGRAGLAMLLRALRQLAKPDRDEVVLPSYTCYSVAAAVVKAGLHPRLVDIRPSTLDYDADRLARTDFSRVLALIATNLYGLPNDLPSLSKLARANGFFLIDDAAQAMGATVGGRACGTWGDAGLFSLDKGKNISAIDGGIVVTRSPDIATAMAREMATAPSPRPAAASLAAVRAVAYFVFLRPWLYWIPNGIPQLGLGNTRFSTEFPLERHSPCLSALGAAMLERLDDFSEARMHNASALRARLHTLESVTLPTPLPDATPVYLRFPLLMADAQARQRAAARLTRSGIGASVSYPASLYDVPQLQDVLRGDAYAVGGRTVAQRVLTLPTHPFVRTADIASIAAILEFETRLPESTQQAEPLTQA